MRCSILLFMVVCAAMMSQSEAWRRAVDSAKKHCQFVNGKVICTFGRKRQATDELSTACNDVANAQQTGFTSDDLLELFNQVDGMNDKDVKDGELDELEFDEFLVLVQALGQCFSSDK
ncbi:uncharacterized protein [Littorina saxatilis]|uniref:Uncharacterized protein n=1 Tax=Littorina saxatilis TaxID=31220 RepID=A0AAN9G3D0_9CAEN